jgi:peroxiredoxin
MRTLWIGLFGLWGCAGADVDAVEDTDAAEVIDGPFGPSNGWHHALRSEVPADLEGTGYDEGDIAYDWTFVDQHGDEVQLYQFYGQVILLDVFAEWCEPCQDHAPEGEVMWNDLRERGFVVLAMMQETSSGVPVDQASAARWADAFELTHPVVADLDQHAGPFADAGGGYPTYPVIGPDMTIMLYDLWPPDQGRLVALMEEEGVW